MAFAKLTRLILFEEIRKQHPKVAVKSTPDFKQAIFETLEKLLGVKRANLTGENARIFDKEVQDFYGNIPAYWNTKRISRHKQALFKHHNVYLSHEITLDTVNNLFSYCNTTSENCVNYANFFGDRILIGHPLTY